MFKSNSLPSYPFSKLGAAGRTSGSGLGHKNNYVDMIGSSHDVP